MAVLDEAIIKAGITNAEQNSKRLLPLVTMLTDRNIAADAATEFLQREFPDDAQQIGEIYGHYRRLMIENSELDFGGLIAEALKLLTGDICRETGSAHIPVRVRRRIPRHQLIAVSHAVRDSQSRHKKSFCRGR